MPRTACKYTIEVDVRRTLLVSIALILPCLTLNAAQTHLLVCYGDSITAGYGLAANQAYPAYLQRDLDQLAYHYQVRNLGTSGATTKDAVAGMQALLALHPAVVIVEFGGNDGLRGLPLSETRKNLNALLSALTASHSRILLAGITLPPNYGPDYIRDFNQMYRDLAAQHHVALVPMMYRDLIRQPGTLQTDGIHPTAKGSEILARTLLRSLRPLLTK